MNRLDITAMALAAMGILGMAISGYAINLLMMALSIVLIVIAALLWEFSFHWEQKREEREARKYRALPKCMGGKGLNHFR